MGLNSSLVESWQLVSELSWIVGHSVGAWESENWLVFENDILNAWYRIGTQLFAEWMNEWINGGMSSPYTETGIKVLLFWPLSLWASLLLNGFLTIRQINILRPQQVPSWGTIIWPSGGIAYLRFLGQLRTHVYLPTPPGWTGQFQPSLKFNPYGPQWSFSLPPRATKCNPKHLSLDLQSLD